MPKPDLEAIRKRLEAVKWPLFSRNAGVRLIYEGRELKLADCQLWKSPGGVPEPQFAVADFFAAAPDDIAALLEWGEKLEHVFADWAVATTSLRVAAIKYYYSRSKDIRELRQNLKTALEKVDILDRERRIALEEGMMLLTEEEARTKECRAGGYFRFVAIEDGPWPRCSASDCMAWRWVDPTDPIAPDEPARERYQYGYCGLGGKPEE